MEGHPRDLEDAGPRAITTYLRTYGPATFDHVHHWLGDNLSAGRKRLDRLAFRVWPTTWSRLTSKAPRRTSWLDDAESLPAARPSNAVRFLPGHDQWVMGPGTKDIHVTPPAIREAMTGKVNPVIVGGVVCGTWAVKKGKKHERDEIAVTWLDERRPPQEAVEEEAQRLPGFLGDDLRLVLAT